MKKSVNILWVAIFIAGCVGVEKHLDAPAAVPETAEAHEVAEEQPPEQAEAQPEDKSEKIRQLMKLLGHNEYRVRENASAELLSMGIHALDQLEAAARSDDIEVRLRATDLGDTIKALVRQSSEIFRDAIESGNTAVVKEIVSRNLADIHATDEVGLTYLHLAARKGYEEIAGILLNAGADANARDEFGDTPVHEAVYWRKEAVVDILLSKGADINSRNVFGHTPLDEVYSKDAVIIEFLRKRGAKTGKELKSTEK